MPRGSTKVALQVTPGGVREDVNIAQVPEGAFLASSNFLTRQGLGRPRPGYVQLGDFFAAADRVLGFGFRGSPDTSDSLVVHTATTAYDWNVAGSTDITGTWATSNPQEAVRFATIVDATGAFIIARVNPANEVDLWDGTGSFADPTSGPAPKGRDICMSNSRFVVVHTTDASGVNPYQVRWSAFLDPNTWPTGSQNTAELAETPDVIVACKPFGPLSAAIYKEDTVWIAQAVASVNPFQFQLVAYVPGPMSPASVIAYRGAHYWVGKDGVLYRFDGTRAEPVASGLITTFRQTFEWSVRLRTHGWCIGLQEPELWWAYPEVASGSMVRGMSLNLVTGALTPHTFADEITASSQWVSQAELTWDRLVSPLTWDTLGDLYPTWDSMGSETSPTAILGGTGGQLYQFGVASTDNLDPIPWSFTHGWKIPDPGSRLTVDGVMSYWHQEGSSLPVTISITATDDLSDSDHAVSRIYDLQTKENHYVTFGDLRGSFVRITQSADEATPTISCRGGILLGWPRGLV